MIGKPLYLNSVKFSLASEASLAKVLRSKEKYELLGKLSRDGGMS
jgi:hypothetical protein